MSDLLVLLPELVLAGVGLVLIVAARRIARAGVAAGLAIAAAVAAIVAGLAFSMDGPSVGFGGTVTADGYAVFFKVLFAANLALVALLSVRHFDAERVRPAEYHALLLLASTGMMLTASAVEFLILYLGLELMSLCAYVLVGITRDKAVSNEAAMKYFLLGSFASALLLYGISLVYGVTGATDFATIAAAPEGRHHVWRSGAIATAGHRDRAHRRRAGIQDRGGTVPRVGARCLRGRQHASRRVPGCRLEGRRPRRAGTRLPGGVRRPSRASGRRS